jgi:hypothetical protein
MSIVEFVEKIKQKDCYKKLNNDNFLYAVFVIMNRNEKSGDKIQLDFYDVSEKKIFFSEHPFDKIEYANETFENCEELKIEGVMLGIGDLWGFVDELDLAIKPSKILGVLKDGIWNLTLMDSALGMTRVNVDAKTKEVLKKEMGSLTDFMGFKKIG